ncbi:MAG TPA: PH domain-containing protein [Candidatus Saccharimonadales bacterium]|nr:PH domain-containing protein [Candidatus Saccharimonadales bacterium]
MVTLHQVEEQLKRIGCNFRFWGRPEIRELTNILLPDEIIAGAVNGRYEGGFALLCVTNHRLLLIDRKPMFLTLEDVRFDMISEMDFSARLLDSTVRINTPNRKLVFTSWSHHRLRKIMNYTQQRVMEVRQHYMMQQFQPAPAPNPQHSSAPMVGGLAVQGDGTAAGQQFMRVAPYPTNPYTKTPVLMRRRRYPKFY